MHFVNSTSPLGLATFQVLNDHMWLVATILERTDPEPGLAGSPQTSGAVCVPMGEQAEVGVEAAHSILLQGLQAPFPTDCTQPLVPAVIARIHRFSLKSLTLAHFCASSCCFDSLMQPVLMSAPAPSCFI